MAWVPDPLADAELEEEVWVMPGGGELLDEAPSPPNVEYPFHNMELTQLEGIT